MGHNWVGKGGIMDGVKRDAFVKCWYLIWQWVIFDR